MNNVQKYNKRIFDIAFSIVVIFITFPVFLLGLVLAAKSSSSSGIFVQKRVGRYGRVFHIYKLRTMKICSDGGDSTITVNGDLRITRVGGYLRKFKIDEIPQFWNVLKGDMSVVGPRPDVPGYADMLGGESRVLLSIRPGITGPATLKYRDEEKLLATVEDPVKYNNETIYPDKVRINCKYIKNYSFVTDVCCVLMTIGLMKNTFNSFN